MTVAAVVEALQLATLIGFLAVAALSLKDWLRLRDPGRGYLALAIGSLGIVSAIGQLVKVLPAGAQGLISDLNLVLFVVSGLALLLFRDTVIPLGRPVKRAVLALSGLIALLAMVAQLPSGSTAAYTPFQFAVVLAVVALWSVSVGEPSVRMWLVSRRLPAVQKARLRALSIGYGGIVALLVATVASLAVSANPAVQIGTALAALAVVPVLYAGFAPPAWLRATWRDKERDLIQKATNDLVMFVPSAAALGEKALDGALRLAGARQGFIAFPGSSILATQGLSIEQAQRLCQEIAQSSPGIRRVTTAAGASLPAIVSPLATEKASGLLVLLAGPFTPVFGDDEVAWTAWYSVLLASGLERMRLMERMSDLNAELARRVQEVTRQKSELEAANKELEAYSYTISHDLRAPLRAINGFTAIILEEYASEFSPEARDMFRRVQQSGKHMGTLVDDLLAFSRLGRLPLRKQSVNTTEIARHAWEQVKLEADGRQVDVRIGDLPICESDPVLLEQVFVNLLSNAVKYSKTRPTAIIEVGVTSVGGPRPGNGSTGQETVFYVKDNGVGFDMQYVGRLFGVFQRLHRAEEYEGTGVGLATVHRIVERHGGRIWVEAAPDRGATFYFTLTGAEQWQAAAA